MPSPCSAVSLDIQMLPWPPKGNLQHTRNTRLLWPRHCPAPSLEPEATRAMSASLAPQRGHSPCVAPEKELNAVHSQRHQRRTKKSFISKSIARQPTQFPSLGLLRDESSVKNIISFSTKPWFSKYGSWPVFQTPQWFLTCRGAAPCPDPGAADP